MTIVRRSSLAAAKAYNPLRGTAADVLRHMRVLNQFDGSVEDLSESVGRPLRNVWNALVILDERKLVYARRDGAGVHLKITSLGRHLRI